MSFDTFLAAMYQYVGQENGTCYVTCKIKEKAYIILVWFLMTSIRTLQKLQNNFL
jgi:hypothetical protein